MKTIKLPENSRLSKHQSAEDWSCRREREGELRSSRSFILSPNWQNRRMIYASKGLSAGGGAPAPPSLHQTQSKDAQQRYEMFRKCLHSAWRIHASPADHPTQSTAAGSHIHYPSLSALMRAAAPPLKILTAFSVEIAHNSDKITNQG